MLTGLFRQADGGCYKPPFCLSKINIPFLKITDCRAPYVFAATKRRVILNAKRERIRNTLKKNGLPQPLTRLRNDRTIAYCTHLTAFVATKRFVILNAKRERIRIPLKRERIAARLSAVSPAGSVGASASQRCPPDTRTAMTGKSGQLAARLTAFVMTVGIAVPYRFKPCSANTFSSTPPNFSAIE